jgi:16S rRNA (guanine527-N7)-methyltransferase
VLKHAIKSEKMDNFGQYINQHFNISLSQDQLYQFDVYYQELVEWNTRFNLTSITDKNDVYLTHFIDSLAFYLINPLPELSGMKVIDIGTGAGFPGIPIKLANPEIKLTLLESNNKKCGFLTHLIGKLNLKNCEIIWSRAEELAHNKVHRAAYDIILSRAVDNMASLLELSSPFLKTGGLNVLWKTKVDLPVDKSQIFEQELGIVQQGVVKYSQPGKDKDRCLVIFKKTGQSKDKYPRKPGIPHKRPLI